MTAQEIEFQVRDFIIEQFLFNKDDGDLPNDASFLETGIVDSTGILEIIAFLEETYGIAIEDDELIPENLDSVDNAVSFVKRKLEAQRAQISTHHS
ncbi:MAG: acyl carrier protein [Candidatus Hodarchaeota archaeon]